MPEPKDTNLRYKFDMRISEAAKAEAEEFARLLGMSVSDVFRLAMMTGLRQLKRQLYPEQFIPKEAWATLMQASGMNVEQVQQVDQERMIQAIGRGMAEAMINRQQGIADTASPDMQAVFKHMLEALDSGSENNETTTGK